MGKGIVLGIVLGIVQALYWFITYHTGRVTIMIAAACTSIRSESSFSTAATYEHQGQRFVKLVTLWASLRCARETVTIDEFYHILKQAKHCDDTPMFSWWNENALYKDPVVHECVWVACPPWNYGIGT